jgi:hypothetical protein
MSRFKGILAVLLGSFFVVANAHASIVTVDFTGTVTDYAGPPAESILGETFAGSYSYDPSQFPLSLGGTPPAFVFSFQVPLLGAYVTTDDLGASGNASTTGANLSPGTNLYLDITSGGGLVSFGGSGHYSFGVDSMNVAPVPLPSASLLFATALIGLGVLAARRKPAFS